MEKVELSRIVDKLESGSREKGGSVDSGIISIGGTHLDNNGGFKWDKKEFVSEDFFLKMRSGKIQNQDILIVKDGATTGKISFVDENFPHKEAAINEHVFRLEINRNLANPKYVFYFLHSPTGQEEILNDFRGATVGGISRGFIDKVELPLPDLETQNKIVAILDKAKAILDKQEETINKYDELLRATFLDMFGDPVKNEKGWEVVNLSQMGTLDRGVSKHRPRNATELLGGKYPLIQTGEVSKSGLYITSYSQTYSELGLKQSKLWDKGTLLITIAANIAQTSILAFDACFPDSVVGFISNKNESNTIYVHHLFSFFQKILEKNAPQSAQKNINLAVLRTLRVPKPPLSLQEEFSKKVNITYALIVKNKRSKLKMENLYSSLSQLAFKGELNFNTAVDLEVLLENDYDFFKENSNSSSIKLLLERLNTNELNDKRFNEQQAYDKAKSFVFELIKEGKVKQVFDEKTKKVKLTV